MHSAGHPPRGSWLRLERKGQDSMVIAPLRAARRIRATSAASCRSWASRELDALKRRFPELELVEEGKARINQVVGYTLAFRVSRKLPRTYGRLYAASAAHAGRA